MCFPIAFFVVLFLIAMWQLASRGNDTW